MKPRGVETEDPAVPKGPTCRGELMAALGSHPFTKHLPEATLSQLASLATKVEFREDEIIIRVGERPRHVYLLLSGSVCVEISSSVYAVCIQALGPGDVFGWAALVDHYRAVFQVRARQPTTAFCLDGPRLLEASCAEPTIGRDIFRRLLSVAAQRVAASEIRLAEFYGVAGSAFASRLARYQPARPSR